MEDKSENPLLSTQTSSDSGLQVILHPLPILSISDRITRFIVRGEKDSLIVMALLGRQNGREITIEESFDCKVDLAANGEYQLDQDWFDSRLEQMQLVFKLDLVGWGTLLHENYGPLPIILPVHKFLLTNYNDSAILLGFDPAKLEKPGSGQLPIAIYESNYEAEATGKEGQQDGEDKEMKESDAGLTMHIKFRPLSYTIEAGEAEMIGMAFVHKGAANATTSASIAEKKAAAAPEAELKGKRRADRAAKVAAEESAISDIVLTQEEQDMLAALTTRKNAMLMLLKRVKLFTAYLRRLPPSFTDAKLPAVEKAMAELGQDTTNDLIPSNNVLRALQAVIANVGLLVQDPQSQFNQELRREANDVNLVSMLGDVLQSIEDVRVLGHQFSIIDGAKAHRLRVGDFAGGSMSHLGGRGFGSSGVHDTLG